MRTRTKLVLFVLAALTAIPVWLHFAGGTENVIPAFLIDEKVDGDLLHKEVASIIERIESDDALSNYNRIEKIYSEIETAVFKPWTDAWLKGNGAEFDSLLADKEATPPWSTGQRTMIRDVEGVQEFTWNLSGKGTANSEAGEYVKGFSQIRDFRLDTFSINTNDDQTQASLKAYYDLRGTNSAKALQQDRGIINIELVNANNTWKVSKIDTENMVSLVATDAHHPTFEDVTTVVGLDSVKVYPRVEAIRRGGYAVAIADYDNDDRPDLLVGNYGPVALYRNTEDGFVDVTEKAGIRGETLVKSAAFADMDNDGQKDLVLLRFVEDDDIYHAEGDFVAYRNRGDGTFEHKGDVLTKTRQYERAMPLALADFDGNGTLDVYVGFPGVRDFTSGIFGRTQSKESQGLWLNKGQWNFTELSKDSELFARNKSTFPHAALVTNLDGDRYPDLVVVDDSGRTNPIYRNSGDAGFSDITEDTGLDGAGWSMGVTAGDFDGDGHIDLALTNVEFLAFHRMFNIKSDSIAPKFFNQELHTMGNNFFRGNQLFRNRGDGTFEEMGEQAGVSWAGEAPAGVEFIDYNNDGHLDMYVANGLWSAGEEEFSSIFARICLSDAVKEYRDSSSYNGRANPILTFLREFHGTLESPGTATAEKPSLSMAGYERNRLFRNNADGTFTEVGYFENADRIEDGYMAATADYDGDGNQDLVLRHCDPAPGYDSSSLTLLRNTRTKGNSLHVFLEGIQSNRNGVGAIVTAMVGERKIVREIRSVAGAVQGQPSAFIGLGDATQADKVEVRWSSGIVQSFPNIASGRVTLREGRALPKFAMR